MAVAQPSDLLSVEGIALEPDTITMAQLLAPVVHCSKRLGTVAGQTVLIIGQGPAGLTLTNVIKNMGADLIVTCDLIDERLQESLRRGADRVIRGGPNLAKIIEKATEGSLFDLVIEAVGEDETVTIATRFARKYGRVVFFGLPGEDTTLRIREFFGKQLLLTSSEYPEQEDFREALRMMTSGQIDMAGMVTHKLPFDEVQRGFELADSRKEGVLRVVLDMGA